MKRVALLFPGQGSQYVGMGESLLAAGAEGKALLQLAERQSGLPLHRLCRQGPLEELTETVNLQPALTLVSLAAWQALQKAGVIPYATAGHSLGEYAALAACGCLSVEKVLELVSLRGRIMHEQALANPGTMAAVMGLSAGEVKALCAQVEEVVQPANYNTPQQTVITGTWEGVAAAGRLIKERKGKIVPLKVSGPWHSPLMRGAEEKMAAVIDKLEFAPPHCLQAPNAGGRLSADPLFIKEELKKQITSPVHWLQTIENMLNEGVEIFIEAGPKNILSGMVKKIVPEGRAEIYNVEDTDTLQVAMRGLDA
ncbi:MAG: ACP S-malonyltransferase [Desulfarculales bacterium]|jgi:[acyl-carrier-protein] S-malonyltransferase|nr:ACP S-malonyltransferase [Desulfarculales bacterium]